MLANLDIRMNKLNIILLIISFFVISCSNKNESTPEIIEKNKLCSLLTDLHIASSAKRLGFLNPKDTIKNSNVNKLIFKKYNTTALQLNKTISYYSQHPDSLNALYIQVIEMVSAKQAQLK